MRSKSYRICHYSCRLSYLLVLQTQTETAPFTMEAEVIALGSCCRELLPIIALVDEIGIAIGIKKSDDKDSNSSIMHVTIHEDNSGALILAMTPPPQFTPCSKHYAIKTIWFREQIIEKKIKVAPIETHLQLETFSPRCLLKSPLNSFGTCFKDGDNHHSRGSVEYD